MEFKFRVQLRGITKPPVWREVVVPADSTFYQFHLVIQAAFGWNGYHLFEFRHNREMRISMPLEPDMALPFIKADTVKLSSIFKSVGQKLEYEYDFGDSWVHQITLLAIGDGTPEVAVCTAGKGACPPDDCGGLSGFDELKNVFATDPYGDEANEYREWMCINDDEVWNPKEVDIDFINFRLRYLDDEIWGYGVHGIAK